MPDVQQYSAELLIKHINRARGDLGLERKNLPGIFNAHVIKASQQLIPHSRFHFLSPVQDLALG